VFIITTDKIIKTVTNTKLFTGISRIRSTDNSVLIYSALRAHSPDTGLEHSTSHIGVTRSTHSVSHLISLYSPSSLSLLCCTPHTLSRHDKTDQFLLFAGLV